MGQRSMGRVSRRGFVLGSAGVAAGLSISGWSGNSWGALRDRSLATALDPAGTTLEATIIASGQGLYRTTTAGPGQPTLTRTDLQVPAAGREDRRQVLASFVQLTDQHLIDAQSTGRVEFLDHENPLFQGSHRPQELLTTQVATSMIDRINQLGRGPIGGRAFDAVVCTGDNIDNQQVNELDWFMTVLDGGLLTPDGGTLGTYEGVQDGVAPQPFWWHPDPGINDDYKATFGFPDIAGLTERALQPFAASGVNAPWYSVYGNHDCNVQGNGARSDALDQVLVGDKKMMGLPAGEAAVPFAVRMLTDTPSILADLTSGVIPSRSVSPDGSRRTATVADWIDKHLASGTGSHGYDAADLSAGRLWYEFALAPGVVGICLDTTNHAGGPNGADGSIGEGQAAWLTERLMAHHARYLAADGTVARSGGDDQLVVLFSHHPASSMTATEPDPTRPTERRVLGDELLALLVRFPNLVAWVNGHTHTNRIRPRLHPEGLASGFWEITTASHVDWPQQARVLELIDNADGTLSLFATMIEHVGPARVDHSATDTAGLAAVSRELGLNDAQAEPESLAGDAQSQNVELVLPAPFVNPGVSAPAAPSSPAPAPAVPVASTPSYTG